MEIFDKFYHDHIEDVNIDNIEFKTFTYEELQLFLITNYYDHDLCSGVFWIDDGYIHPFGLHYLEFDIPYKDNQYVLGIVDNNIGGKTIAFCMEYDNNYRVPLEEEIKVGYIIFIETNYYFRNKGVLRRAFDYIKEEFSNYDVLTMTSLSGDGNKILLFDRFVDLFKDTNVKVEKSDYVNFLVRKRKKT